MAVSSRENSNRTIQYLLAENSGYESVSQTQALLKKAWTKLHLKNHKLYLVYPRSECTLKFYRLPTADIKEVGPMLRLKAAKETPFPMEELLLKHEVLKTDSHGFTHVILAILRKEHITRLIELLKGAGLTAGRIILDIQVKTRFLRDKGIEDAVLWDIDYQEIQCHIVESGTTRLSQSIAVNPNDAFDDSFSESITGLKLKRLCQNVKHDLESRNIKESVITGASLYKSALQDVLKGSGIKTGSSSQDIFQPDGAPYVSETGLGKNQCSFASVLSMASLGNEARQTDLNPEEILLARRRNESLKRHAVTAALSGLAVILGLSFISVESQGMERYAKALDQNIALIRQDARRVKAKFDHVQAIQNQIALKGSVLDLLKEVYERVPADCPLSSFQYDEGKKIALRGTSRSMDHVIAMVRDLEKSEYFDQVNIEFATRSGKDAGSSVNYSVSCEIKRVI